MVTGVNGSDREDDNPVHLTINIDILIFIYLENSKTANKLISVSLNRRVMANVVVFNKE